MGGFSWCRWNDLVLPVILVLPLLLVQPVYAQGGARPRPSRIVRASVIESALQKHGNWQAAGKELGADCVFEDQQLVEFAWRSNVVELDDACLERLARETSLKKLSLTARVSFTGVGLGALQSLTRLEELTIVNDKITSTAVLQLASLKRLKKLTITSIHVSEKVLDVLRAELPDCEVIRG